MSNGDAADEKEDLMSDAAMNAKAGGRRQSGDYAALQSVLDEAYRQSAEGKGNARHANDKPFDKQPILEIGRMVGPGFAAGQVMKKAQEALGMAARGETEAAANELLGAIVYAASAVVLVREKAEPAFKNGDYVEGTMSWPSGGVRLHHAEPPLDTSRLIEPEVAPRPFKVGDRVDLKATVSDFEPERGKVTYLGGGSKVCVLWDQSGESWHYPQTLVHVD